MAVLSKFWTGIAIAAGLAYAILAPATARSITMDEMDPAPVWQMALIPDHGVDLAEPVQQKPAHMSSAPRAPHEYGAAERYRASVSAYTAHASQTDDTPNITANGEHVRDGGIACPTRYEFGTRVRIDGRIYTCNDRMNARYQGGDYFDIFMSDYAQAIRFGRQHVIVEVLR